MTHMNVSCSIDNNDNDVYFIFKLVTSNSQIVEL